MSGGHRNFSSRKVTDLEPPSVVLREDNLKGDPEVRVVSSTGGEKGQKEARYDLIPGKSLELLARLYGRGAGKYEDRNWERGYDWSLSFAALQRHIWQFWNGEDIDEEMDMPHVACAIFHAFALLEFMAEHPEFDDRPSTVRARTAKSPLPEHRGPSDDGATVAGTDGEVNG